MKHMLVILLERLRGNVVPEYRNDLFFNNVMVCIRNKDYKVCYDWNNEDSSAQSGSNHGYCREYLIMIQQSMQVTPQPFVLKPASAHGSQFQQSRQLDRGRDGQRSAQPNDGPFGMDQIARKTRRSMLPHQQPERC